VRDPEGFMSLVAALSDEGVVPMLIHRDGSPRFLALRLGK
jgi:hypothetical protein